jgi:hypothetical protein
MLASDAMKEQRTTVTAALDDLETLRGEARRRGVSLAQLMRETLAEKAAELRAGRRPRVGVGRGGGRSVAQESVEDEDAPARGD